MCFFFQWKTWKSANFFSVLPVNGRTWLFFALSPLRDQWKSQEGPNVTKFSTTFARDLNTMHEESNCQRPLFLSNQSCGVHLIAELLWRGEVMQGVRRRERVVMVEICMVVEGLVLQPVRSRLVRQVRGRIYSWRGQRLLVWRQEPAQLGSQWKRSSNGIKLWSFKLDLSSVT